MKDYGYWFAEDGGLIPVAYQAHDQAADKYISNHLYKEYLAWVGGQEYADPSLFVLQRGWIRTSKGVKGKGNELNIEFYANKIDNKALKALTKLIKDNAYTTFYVDINKDKGSNSFIRFDVDEERALMSVLRKNLDRKTMEAALSDMKFTKNGTERGKDLKSARVVIRKDTPLLADDYDDDLSFECWIRDDGRAYPLTSTHKDAFLKYVASNPEIKKAYEKSIPTDLRKSNHSVYNYATNDLGWIRVAGSSDSASVMISKNAVSPKAFRGLAEHFRHVDRGAICYLDVLSGNTQKNGQYNPSRMLSEVKANIKKVTAADKFDSNAWWVTNEGKIIEVGEDNEHGDVAAKHFKKDRTKVKDSVDYALKAGWIRVRKNSNTIYVNAAQDRYNRAAVYASGKLLNEQSADNIELEIFVGVHDEMDMQYMPANRTGVTKMMHILKKYVKREAMAASTSFYGAWITDEGKVLQVDESHLVSFIVYKSRLKDLSAAFETYEPDWSMSKRCYAYALDVLGWIRVVSEGRSLSVEIEPGKVSRRAVSAMPKFLKEAGEYTHLTVESKQNGYKEFIGDNPGPLMQYLRQNVAERTMAASETSMITIDDLNNYLPDGRVIESWSSEDGTRIHLLEMPNNDYVIQYIKPDGEFATETFRFLETARDAILNRVLEIRKQTSDVYMRTEARDFPDDAKTYTLKVNDSDGSLLKILEALKYLGDVGASRSVLIKEGGKDHKDLELGYDGDGADKIYEIKTDSELTAAEGEKVLERWEGMVEGRSRAFELKTQGTGFDVLEYVFAATVKIWKKIGATYVKGDEAEARKRFAKMLEPLIRKYRISQVDLSKKAPPQADAKNFKDYSDQPRIKGLRLAFQKIGSVTYAKIVHSDSGRTVVNLSQNPLTISLQELLQRIDLSRDLGTIDWQLSPVQLDKKYTATEVINRARRFSESLATPIDELQNRSAGKTQKALDDGLRDLVREYLVAYYTKNASVKDISKRIEERVARENLSAPAVFDAFGDIHDENARVWEKVGLIRTGDKAPYKYVTDAENKTEKADTKMYTDDDSKYTWKASPAGQKAFFSIYLDGKTKMHVSIKDQSFVEAIVDIGNSILRKRPVEFPTHRYFKDLTWKKIIGDPYVTYNLFSEGKPIAKIYNPEGTVQTILLLIQKRMKDLDNPPEKNDTRTYIGSYVEGIDRNGETQRGILQTQAGKMPKVAGDAIVLVKGRLRRLPLSNVKRTLLKPPKELLDAVKEVRERDAA